MKNEFYNQYFIQSTCSFLNNGAKNLFKEILGTLKHYQSLNQL